MESEVIVPKEGRWEKAIALISIVACLVMFGWLMSSAFAASPETTFPLRVICSGSMSPTMDCHSKLFGSYLSAEDTRSLSIGDVVLYDPRFWDNPTSWLRTSCQYWGCGKVIHRIVGYENGCYITKGDANEVVDDICVKPAMVMFKVTRWQNG
jgi:signal peptidase I